MEIENWFSTPIYYHHLEDPILSKCQQEISSSVDNLSASHLDSPWEDTVETTFSYKDDNNFLVSAPTLRNEILNHSAIFAKNLELEFNDIRLTESWLNITKKGGFQHYHNHIPYDISAVYYHKTSGNDGNTVFKDPALIKSTSKLLKNLPRTVRYKPREGTIILFPSFLEHCVYHNENETARISIACNLNIDI
jgi:uncharacterized protein (TIGR02466 family)